MRRLNWLDVQNLLDLLVPFCGLANCCAQEQDHAFHDRPSSRSPHRWVVAEAAAGSPSRDYKLAMDSAVFAHRMAMCFPWTIAKATVRANACSRTKGKPEERP